jgi:regulator of protease activity HflC (stomatin/prohibitin superfamily)
MFDKLIDVLVGWFEVLRFATVVADYERTVQLRWGRYRATLEPGLHWILPLADSILSCYTVPNTMRMHDQSLRTKDGMDLAVAGIITYCVSDPRVFLLKIEGGEQAIGDCAYGAVAEWVASNDYSVVADPENWSKLESKIRRAAKDYGIDILRFKFSDLARAKALRLLGDAR